MKYSPAYSMHQQRIPIAQAYVKTDLVAAANEGPTCYIQEAHILRHLLPPIELSRLNVAIDLHMPLRRTHVLSECHDVHIDHAEFAKRVHDLVFRLPDTEHDASLRHTYTLLLRALENSQASTESRSPITYKRRHRLGRLDIVGINIQSGLGYYGDMVQITVHVSRQRLYEDMRCSMKRQGSSE